MINNKKNLDKTLVDKNENKKENRSFSDLFETNPLNFNIEEDPKEKQQFVEKYLKEITKNELVEIIIKESTSIEVKEYINNQLNQYCGNLNLYSIDIFIKNQSPSKKFYQFI